MANNQGGKYILDTYVKSEYQEQTLLNIKLLKKRLQERCLDKPFLLNLETTHNNYIKRYYKPTIPMSFEIKKEVSEFSLQYGSNTFSLPLYGDFMYEMVLEIELTGLSVQNPLDKCAYYDFLGHKLINYVAIEFAGIKIDEYTGEAYNIYYNYYIPDEKKQAYMRAVGQEVPEKVIVDLENIREEKYLLTGPQSPKTTHNSVKMYIPIIFDLSAKLNCSLFSAKIPYGQRFLKVVLNQPENICYSVNGGLLNLPSISGSLYITHIFIDESVKSQLKLGNYKSLIRVHKEISFSSQILGIQKLDALRFPVEDMFVGLRPNTNVNPDDWYKFTSFNARQVTFPIALSNALPPPTYQLAFRTVTHKTPVLPLISINFLTKSTNIINPISAEYFATAHSFFKSISAHDTGIIPVSFTHKIKNSFSEDDSVVSFYNVSLEREFYLKYEAILPGTIYILAKCLNWINIKEDGTVELVYTS